VDFRGVVFLGRRITVFLRHVGRATSESLQRLLHAQPRKQPLRPDRLDDEIRDDKYNVWNKISKPEGASHRARFPIGRLAVAPRRGARTAETRENLLSDDLLRLEQGVFQRNPPYAVIENHRIVDRLAYLYLGLRRDHRLR